MESIGKERILQILVFIKQVPDTGTNLQLQEGGEGIEESGIEWIINPYDEFALEEALRIKERITDTEVVVFSLGPSRVAKALRQALAMGADRACFIEHKDPTWPAQTARALAKAVQQEPKWDLILCGKGSVDENHSAVGPMTAELLNIPHVSFVTKLDLKEKDQWVCERNRTTGLKEEISLSLPALITVDKGINQPRYPTLPGIMKAKKKEIKTLSFSTFMELKLEPDSLCFQSYRLPPPPPPPHFITGTPEEQAKELIRILTKEKQLI